MRVKMRIHFDIIRKIRQFLGCHRRCSITRSLVIITVISLVSLLLLNLYNSPLTKKEEKKATHEPPSPSFTCNEYNSARGQEFGPNEHYSEKNLKISRRVLLFIESTSARHSKIIASAIDAARFPFKVLTDLKNLPTLTHMDKGRFGVVVFESIELFLKMDDWNKQILEKYCRRFDVGMIFLSRTNEDLDVHFEKIPSFAFTVQYNVPIQNYRLNSKSEVWRVLRPGEIIAETYKDEWTVFHCNHSTYEALAFAQSKPSYYDDYEPLKEEANGSIVIPAMLDKGLRDGIRKIFLGNDFTFWLHGPMLMDSISFLSHGKLSLSLDRYMQIDIDDIFVGANGTRMKPVDVQALLNTQTRLQKVIDGFHFMLGFSGWYYLHGTQEEDDGDRMLIEYKHHFYWFPHMWRHEQAHKFSEQDLHKNMYLNYNFAQEHKIPVVHQYAVAPHHAGVYPVHEDLYNAWKSVWDIRVTSTEEYPRLYPSWNRKGLIHKGIMVLPRQTCGLFTHTIFMDTYPGGRAKLDNSIHGGELFKAFLYNPVTIYMTHLSNYGNDRLALYTFESVVNFLQCWTNFKLIQKTPIELAIKYFEIFPEEETPVWRNPCDYDRHLEIWSANKTCDKLPKFLVIGPQKTGTSALYTFLSMHPNIKSNYMSQDTFEEVQFFSGSNYLKGIDWYMEFFPRPNNSSSEYLFEKSATYFDNIYVPMRVKALLPSVKVISIIVNPVQRAYSWYQHMRAHSDPIASNYTFYDVITASDTAPSRVKSLRNRCLNPGMYEHYLQKWLDYFPSRQLYVVDGEKLKNEPYLIMEKMQQFLNIQPRVDYSKILRFDANKGFYCQVLSNDKTKCLGRSKGRKYPPIDSPSEKYLQQFYSDHNVRLAKLLTELGVNLPSWLQAELKS